MLELKNIKKDYQTKYLTVHAIKDLSIAFRKSEFVSILGPSGCGKTTLLNLIGGLDRYNSGDLIINGRSTKEYNNKEWDAYRNHTIGFVFQSYNLIMHLNVLENVEMSLKLAGMSKALREEKVLQVLKKVGLEDKAKALPNELSGGQMQRVAIARALVNDPEIVLADEPTGALDSETSIQILDLLKEIASDRLVIMVTHNPDLALNYSTRIVEMLDGKLVNDSNPYQVDNAENGDSVNGKKPSMSFMTALKLSFKNMLTKKARTILVSLAGSIGIIGIALILAMSHGFQTYINEVQESALAEYPLSITRQAVDYSFLTDLIRDIGEGEVEEVDEIKVRNILVRFSEGMQENKTVNDLKALKTFLDNNEEIQKLSTQIKYNYNTDFYCFAGGDNPDPYCINPLPSSLQMMRGFVQWEELIDSKSVNDNKYELLAGSMPDEPNEIIVVLNGKGEISDLALYMLGERSMADLLAAYQGSKTDNDFAKTYDFDYFVGKELRFVTDSDFYELETVTIDNGEETKEEQRIRQIVDINKDNFTQEDLMNIYGIITKKAMTLKISGVVKSTTTSTTSPSAFIGGVAYNHQLNDLVIAHNMESNVVKTQYASKDINLFDGSEFKDDGIYSKEDYFNAVMNALGYANVEDPRSILIYANTFENKDRIIEILEEYNKGKSEDDKIKYTDQLGILMNSISTIINAVSYVLIAFVSVSLVVSSIMIGVITYISVLERTKEIGVLRSIGASKKDISRVFNAETLIIGFVSGALGILISLLFLIPINEIIKHLTEIANMGRLPLGGAIALIVVSTLLTLIAGIIPSRIAAKRDPVKALRSE